MRGCVYCKSRYEQGSSITFHKFPSDNTQKLWLKNMKLDNWSPKSCDSLCSKHFTDDCFVKHLSRTTLKKCSIPTIFLETDSPLVITEMSHDDQCCQDVNMNLVSTSSVPGQVELQKNMLPNQSLTTETDSPLVKTEMSQDDQCSQPVKIFLVSAITDKITSNTASQCSPKRSRTLAEVCASIKLDHHYENTPKTSELQRVKRSLKMSQARVKVLAQHVKRLKSRVSTLKNVIADFKKKKKGEQFAIIDIIK